MSENEDIRWVQRFNSFSRAFGLLREFVEGNEDILALEPIVKEGIIQRFEYTFELAWKTLKDKMEHDGIAIKQISPRHMFKLAHQSKYIKKIEIWLKMTNDRNLMIHTSDLATFDKVLESLKNDYYPLLNDFYISLIEERVQ
ncbi:HI0074 family nucleotidyltransferase substrate-binding subunit [Candidatus Spongiihabitans sp.]|uniref:HI0074 family nucleotidyltransferase substrate-binding subunit n=1 Tax=Candidatus Spongiihabitans sp. TaxID=3101308 RepID=UPI003C7027E0